MIEVWINDNLKNFFGMNSRESEDRFHNELFESFQEMKGKKPMLQSKVFIVVSTQAFGGHRPCQDSNVTKSQPWALKSFAKDSEFYSFDTKSVVSERVRKREALRG